VSVGWRQVDQARGQTGMRRGASARTVNRRRISLQINEIISARPLIGVLVRGDPHEQRVGDHRQRKQPPLDVC